MSSKQPKGGDAYRGWAEKNPDAVAGYFQDFATDARGREWFHARTHLHTILIGPRIRVHARPSASMRWVARQYTQALEEDVNGIIEGRQRE